MAEPGASARQLLTPTELAAQRSRMARLERNRVAIKRLRKQGESWQEIGKFYGVETGDMAAFEDRFGRRPRRMSY